MASPSPSPWRGSDAALSSPRALLGAAAGGAGAPRATPSADTRAGPEEAFTPYGPVVPVGSAPNSRRFATPSARAFATPRDTRGCVTFSVAGPAGALARASDPTTPHTVTTTALVATDATTWAPAGVLYGDRTAPAAPGASGRTAAAASRLAAAPAAGAAAAEDQVAEAVLLEAVAEAEEATRCAEAHLFAQRSGLRAFPPPLC
jgi:hypothetical protein